MAVGNLSGFKYLAKKNSYGYLIVTILVLILGIALSILNWHVTENRDNKNLVTKYQQDLNQSKLIITQSLDQYTLLLNDGSSLLSVESNNITQAQWLTFFQSYNLPANYPGVDAVSFSQYVINDNLPGYLSNLEAQGENLNITPAGTRSAYTPVTYIGYVSPTSLGALGYDQFTNKVRAAAINTAINSGQIAMTGKINLVSLNKNQPAFLIYKPIYDGPSATLAERQSSIYGLVFIAVNSNDFLNALLYHYISPGIALQVYDSSATASNLLYQTPSYLKTTAHLTNPIHSTLNFNFAGRSWIFKVITDRKLIQSSSNQNANVALTLGIALSALVTILLWYFTYYRERKIYWLRQKEVQEAKDELLSLASHQLRTPATIVKQYLGILLQNYGGKISAQQRKIIKTAYESNERQLEIANQFLDAAKLGSGRIKLSKKQIVLNDIVKQVVEEQQPLAAQRKQKLVFNDPKRKHTIRADSKYLPMVFENLISNAIKYSKQKTKITIRIRRTAGEVQVSVSDEGMGIPKDGLPLIFEKFSHSLNTQNADDSGTGIGLYLAKQISEMHGGNITVKSTVGKGSEFTVHLPVRRR